MGGVQRGFEDAWQLPEGCGYIRNGAQRPGGQRSVDAFFGERQRLPRPGQPAVSEPRRQ